jgi:hypothetical protein
MRWDFGARRATRERRSRRVTPSLVVAVLALFVGLGGGAFAASTINGSHLKNRSVAGKKLKKNTVTGTEVNESKLGSVPLADKATLADTATDANTVGGKAPSAFVGSTVHRVESAIAAGTPLGDGTNYIDQACPAGEVMLNGGPANVAASSVMVESFPTPGKTNSWRARIKPAAADNFSVVVLCAHQ